jgi:hypothetical protein
MSEVRKKNDIPCYRLFLENFIELKNSLVAEYV